MICSIPYLDPTWEKIGYVTVAVFANVALLAFIAPRMWDCIMRLLRSRGKVEFLFVAALSLLFIRSAVTKSIMPVSVPIPAQTGSKAITIGEYDSGKTNVSSPNKNDKTFTSPKLTYLATNTEPAAIRIYDFNVENDFQNTNVHITLKWFATNEIDLAYAHLRFAPEIKMGQGRSVFSVIPHDVMTLNGIEQFGANYYTTYRTEKTHTDGKKGFYDILYTPPPPPSTTYA